MLNELQYRGGGTRMPGGVGAGNGGLGLPAAQPQTPAEDPWLQQLMEFYKHMMGPLDMNDPQVASIMNTAYAQGQRTADRRGIGGPLGVGNAQGAMVGAGAQLMSQRQGMGLQALGTGLQGKIGLGNLAADEAWRKYQSDLNAWQMRNGQNQANGQAWGAGIGGVIGGGLGLAASFIPGLQPFAPALIGGGASLGSSIGGGVGGASTPLSGTVPTYGKMTPSGGRRF